MTWAMSAPFYHSVRNDALQLLGFVGKMGLYLYSRLRSRLDKRSVLEHRRVSVSAPPILSTTGALKASLY
jgi:hypothetical protein